MPSSRNNAASPSSKRRKTSINAVIERGNDENNAPSPDVPCSSSACGGNGDIIDLTDASEVSSDASRNGGNNKLVQLRHKDGQCPTCGMATFTVNDALRTPINNEYVMMGRCLLCFPLPSNTTRNPSFPAAALPITPPRTVPPATAAFPPAAAPPILPPCTVPPTASPPAAAPPMPPPRTVPPATVPPIPPPPTVPPAAAPSDAQSITASVSSGLEQPCTLLTTGWENQNLRNPLLSPRNRSPDVARSSIATSDTRTPTPTRRGRSVVAPAVETSPPAAPINTQSNTATSTVSVPLGLEQPGTLQTTGWENQTRSS